MCIRCGGRFKGANEVEKHLKNYCLAKWKEEQTKMRKCGKCAKDVIYSGDHICQTKIL
jgi:hypothetical protein